MLPPETLDALRVSRFFPAPRERVFRAFTVPDEFKQWWGPGRYTTPAVEMDVRAGGRYRVTMRRADGTQQYLFGTYLEVRPPERLVMTWSLEGTETNDGYEALLTIDFRVKGEGTELVLLHEKIPSRALGHYDQGWTLSFEQLAAYLARVCTSQAG